LAKIYLEIEDLNDSDVKVKMDADDDDTDFMEMDEEDLSPAQHLAKRVFAFISTIEAEGEIQ
jgi:hypothetical protein